MQSIGFLFLAELGRSFDSFHYAQLQAFVEQMLQGHRLTLSMDGVGLDVHVKLDRNCHLDEPNMEEKRWCLGRNLTSKEMIE